MDLVPTHMNAIVLEKAGAPAALTKIPVPTPLPGQVLIKVDSSPINPSDLMFMNGLYGTSKPFPCVAGFEGSGIVVSEGELLGKRVSFASSPNSGTYADYAVTYSFLCCPILDNVDLRVASSAFVNPLTVVAMLDLVQQANVTAVVHTAAASQLGRMMVRYFQENGVKVINVVRRQEQADLLKAEGAEFILDQTDVNFIEKLTALTTELKATICFDAIGGEIAGRILSALPNKSTLYNYGGLSGQSISEVSVLDLIFKEKTLTGFWLSSYFAQGPNRLSECQQKAQKNSATFVSVIAQEFTLEQFDEAISFYKANMTAGKILFRPTQTK